MVPVDLGKLRNHIDYIRRTVRCLREISRNDRADFLEDDVRQAASIRYLQTAIEAVLDIANHIVAREGFGIPKSYQEAVDLLVTNGILPSADEDTYRTMVRFRNRAVHLYDEIDAGEIHDILTSHLDDFERFLGAVTARYFRNDS
jgi:uncharacterized protein YutE (UPF0331/DUF86 family)